MITNDIIDTTTLNSIKINFLMFINRLLLNKTKLLMKYNNI